MDTRWRCLMFLLQAANGALSLAQCQCGHDSSRLHRKESKPADACSRSGAYFTAHTSSTSNVTLLSINQLM